MSETQIVKITLDCVSVYRQNLSDEELSSFRSRAREIPSLIFTRGLAYALLYVASRSSASVFDVGLNVSRCEDLTSKIKDLKKIDSKEKMGYAVYGALIAYLLRRLGATNASKFDDLLKESLANPLMDFRVRVAVDWIKRLAEAYIVEE